MKRAAHLLSTRNGIDRALAQVLRQNWKRKTMRIVFSYMVNPETEEVGRLLLGVVVAKENGIELARDIFAGVSDKMLVRYALPEAAAALAASDPNRARDLLRVALNARKGDFTRKKWTRIDSRISCNRRFSLATTSAYLGDAQGVEFFTSDLRHPGIGKLKRRFEAQRRTAQYLGTSADYLSVRKAVFSTEPSRKAGRAKLVEALDPDFPLAVVTAGPVWLLVRGSYGKEAYPGHLLAGPTWHGPVDFPFPSNVLPLFLEFHIADPSVLDKESLAYLRHFAPIGCRDLFTARLLRGIEVEAFVGKCELPQEVSEAVLGGQSEAKVRALWRKTTASLMARTDAQITQQNAKHLLPEIQLMDLGLERIPAQSFGSEGCTKEDTVQLLFAFDDKQAEFFPGTFEGVWRHTTRPLVVHIFGRGLRADMFENWTTQFCRPKGAQKEIGVRFVWRDLSGVKLGDASSLEPYISVSTLDRLLAPVLLHDTEKIVYLDVDILVRRDISCLFDLNLGNAPLAAHSGSLKRISTGIGVLSKRDHGKKMQETLRNAFFSGNVVFKRFNAGVLVMNLAKMRRDRAVEKTLSFVRACGVNDQEALNLYVRDRRIPLAEEWNFRLLSRLSEDPAIAHFTGPVKPWHDIPLPFRQEWQENARRAQARI